VSGARNGLIFGATSGGKFISVSDPNAALYLGLKAIEDGRPILIAADARVGKYKSAIKVLNVDVPMADGAPFIAYETHCDTIWLSVERFEQKFIPIFVPGPVRRPGETFDSFRERWFSFYSDQVNRILTGDPYSLALRAQWARLFAENLDPNQIVGPQPPAPSRDR
jgi:hypothetical protein